MLFSPWYPTSTAWILTQKGTVIPRQSLRRLTADEISDSNEVEGLKRASFTADITAKLGDSVKLPLTPLPDWIEPDWNSESYGDDSTTEHELSRLISLKIWRIHFDDAARTLEVTTQRIRQIPDSSLSRNASTNDRAVQY